MGISDYELVLILVGAPVHEQRHVFHLEPLEILQGSQLLLEGSYLIILGGEVNKDRKQPLLILNELPLKAWLLDQGHQETLLVPVQYLIAEVRLTYYKVKGVKSVVRAVHVKIKIIKESKVLHIITFYQYFDKLYIFEFRDEIIYHF